MSAAVFKKLTEFQFYVLIFSLPFEYYFAGREHALLSTLKLQAVLLAATWIFGEICKRDLFRSLRPNLRAFSSDRLALAVLVFIAIELAASAFAPAYRANAWKASIKTAVGALLAVVAADLISSSREALQRSRLLLVFALSGTSVALLGFGERAGIGVFVRIVNLFQPFRYFLGYRPRMVSTMEYPNTAGSFLAVTICATLALTMFPAARGAQWKRVAYSAMILVQTLALTLTYSRGAMGAAVVAIAAAAWFSRGWERDRYAAASLVASLVLLISGISYLSLIRRTADFEKPVVAKRIVHYGLDAGDQAKIFRPGRKYLQTIAVQNQSNAVWHRGEQGLAYRWYEFRARRTSPLFIGADFPEDIPPEGSGRIPVTLRIPDVEGEYLLVWFIFDRDDGIRELKDSFSPGILCSIERGPGMVAAPAATDPYANAIEGERRELNNALVPGRWELWSAAYKMARHRPLLGIGPDNFRILKWAYMDLPKGDETILANNLYLELLSGSGVLGLASFLWLAWEFGRRITRAVPLRNPSGAGITFFGISYLTALLAHGFVDYFLKFTPTFLLFWLLLGSLSRRSSQGGAVESGV